PGAVGCLMRSSMLLPRDDSLRRPCARAHFDRVIGSSAEESLPQTPRELRLSILRQVSDIPTRRPLTEQERLPVILECREVERHGQRRFGDLVQARVLPECAELASLA